MALSLRKRIVLTVVPSLTLLAALGGIGIFLLYQVSERINLILRDNYDSVVAMVGLNEALERIDSSFNYAMLGEEDKAHDAYLENWKQYVIHLDKEKDNITLPGEAELVDQLDRLTNDYHKAGDRFYSLGPAARSKAYLGRGGLLEQFTKIKKVARDIRLLNQQNMEDMSKQARETATASLWWFSGGLAVAALVGGLLTWSTSRSILRRIQGVTQSALAIGGGNLNQVVPVMGHDEIGQLAEAFNRMTRQLRDFRQSHLAKLLRAQRTSQATIDSFPDPILVVDLEGRVEMANPASRHLLGIAPPEHGQEPAMVWQPPEALRQPLREALQAQRPYLTQAFDQGLTFRLGGEERTYLPQVLPIQDPYGYTMGAAVVLDDVTRFRLLDQLKSNLVATVSHELKTPLTSVRLVLHLLLEETVGPLTPKQTELLVDARDNAERLLSMIEHLLAMASLERGQASLTMQPESPQTLLQVAADAARPRAEDRHVDLVVEDASALPPVAADAGRLGHALNNLLDNALTYTDAGGRITLSAASV